MAASPKFIAVFCTAEIPPNARNRLISFQPKVFAWLSFLRRILTTFLNEAYTASTPEITYAFVTSNDPAIPLGAARPPAENAIKTSDVYECAHAVLHMEQRSDNIADRRYFVMLDHHTLQPDNGCIIGDVKGENYVRCQFGTSLLAVEALRSGHKRWPDLWLDAALAGGTIPQPRYANSRYQSFADREDAQRCARVIRERKIENDEPGKDIPIAVICTADIPLPVLDEFLAESDAEDFCGLCILDTPEPNQDTHSTIGPLQNFTSPFLGKDFAWILQFATDVFPTSSLDNFKFMVLDSITLSKRTVLQVDLKGAWFPDVEVVDSMQYDISAVRKSFEASYTSLAEGSMGEFASEAANAGGVYQF